MTVKEKDDKTIEKVSLIIEPNVAEHTAELVVDLTGATTPGGAPRASLPTTTPPLEGNGVVAGERANTVRPYEDPIVGAVTDRPEGIANHPGADAPPLQGRGIARNDSGAREDPVVGAVTDRPEGIAAGAYGMLPYEGMSVGADPVSAYEDPIVGAVTDRPEGIANHPGADAPPLQGRGMVRNDVVVGRDAPGTPNHNDNTPLEHEELWHKYKQTNSIELRNELVLQYLAIPKRVVGRMYSSVGAHMSYEDLLSYGVLGLMDAVEKFDISRQTKFDQYAKIRVKGEIIDYIRSQDWASISLRQKIKMIEDVYKDEEVKSRGNVSDEEIADRLNLDVSEVRKTLEKSFAFNLVYMDDVVRYGGEAADDIHLEEVCADKERREVLSRLVSRLSEKEKVVLNLYYVEEMTLKEVGMVLGVTESRVSQINSKILIKLRAEFEGMGYCWD